MISVIDLSKYNVITSWDAVKAACNVVVLRLGFRGYTTGKIAYDPKFKEYLAACQEHGIAYSAYFFPCSITDTEAIEEADFCADAVKGLTLSVPLFADSEVSDVKHRSGRSDHLSKDQRTHLLKVFCDRLQAKGVPAGIYGSTSWLNNNLDMSQLPYTVWVAQYGAECKYTGKYLMWQYTDKAIVGGTRVDMSHLYDHVMTTCRTLKEGMKGEDVKLMQSVIGAKQDGVFGFQTLQCLTNYQKAHGLVPDGICGKDTWGSIF